MCDRLTVWLAHVVEHPGPSLVQHVLQKHHLTGPGLHALHQTKGHVPTPKIMFLILLEALILSTHDMHVHSQMYPIIFF